MGFETTTFSLEGEETASGWRSLSRNDNVSGGQPPASASPASVGFDTTLSQPHAMFDAGSGSDAYIHG